MSRTFILSITIILISGFHVRGSAQLAFTASQEVGSYTSREVALGDADGDGDLDVFVSNWFPIADDQASKLWLNNGDGLFSDAGISLPAGQNSMALGDLDNDGDLDVWLGGVQHAQDFGGEVWLNDGAGHFSLASTGYMSGEPALGDLDGDGDPDAFVVNYSLGIRVYKNNGAGQFAYTQMYSQARAAVVSLADLDNDGDLDAFVTSYGDEQYLDGRPDKAWLNNGAGQFTATGQDIDLLQGYDLALGDVDNDGDVDALVGNAHRYPYYWLEAQPNKLWLNTGGGFFYESGEDMGTWPMSGVALGDVDHDGDLDALMFNSVGDLALSRANTIMINDGTGRFADSGLRLGDSESSDGALGDLNGDGNLDIFVVNYGPPDGEPNVVWVNSTTVPVLLSQFSIRLVQDAVHVTWLVAGDHTPGEFHVTADRQDERWDVPVEALSARRFEAVDRSPSLTAGGTVVYTLLTREGNEDWHLLRTERVAIRPPEADTRILGAYPNPLGPTGTKISFFVSTPQRINIGVYDVAGRVVTPLTERTYGSGDHAIHWDGRDLRGRGVSSGLYFLRLDGSKGRDVRKLLVVR